MGGEPATPPGPEFDEFPGPGDDRKRKFTELEQWGESHGWIKRVENTRRLVCEHGDYRLLMMSHNVWHSVALLAAALVVLLAAVACEPWPPVEYENATSQRVTVYKSGKFSLGLEPHQSVKAHASEDVWLPDIKVVAEDGRVLLEDHITWDEVREMGYRIVITDPEHPPSPTPTP